MLHAAQIDRMRPTYRKGPASDVYLIAESETSTSGAGGTIWFTGVPQTPSWAGGTDHSLYGTWIQYYYLFRHDADRRMNLTCMDGHVNSITVDEMFDNPVATWDYWYSR